MTAPDAVLFWSGGKDSAWALHVCRPQVKALLATTSGEDVAVHRVPVVLLEAQADAAGLTLRTVDVPDPCPNEVYEAALADALAEETAVVFGDLFLEDVRAWREALMARLGVATRFPLWGRDTGALAREMIGRGLRARIVCVDTTQLDASFLGREFDAALLADLPPHVDPCAENGEFHTFAWAGPMFARPVAFRTRGATTSAGGRFAHLELAAPA